MKKKKSRGEREVKEEQEGVGGERGGEEGGERGQWKCNRNERIGGGKTRFQTRIQILLGNEGNTLILVNTRQRLFWPFFLLFFS